MISNLRAAARRLLHFLIVVCTLAPAGAAFAQLDQPAAELPAQADDRARLALILARTRHAPLTLYAPTALPDALTAGQATDVKFTILVGGAPGVPPQVSLQVFGLGRTVPMRDDGVAPDLSAGDRIYSALVQFSAADAAAGRCYDVVASSTSPTGTLVSAARRVCASGLPIGTAPSDTGASNVVDFPDGGQTFPVVADEALIRVSPSLGDDRIARIAASVGGTVVGSVPTQNVYQIRLAGPQTADGLQQTLAKLRRAGGVLLAVPNAIGGLQTPTVTPVTTTDPQLPTQWGLDRINARRAWAISTGDASTLIAVVDTGADFDHPDFWDTPAGTGTRFATSGSNLVAGDCTGSGCAAVSQPTTCHATNVCNSGNAAADTYGHGTVVSGFPGAFTNNAAGVAGVNWQARLLTVRYATANSTATSAKLMDGMNYARGQGARIISVSTAMSAPFTSGILCPVVTSAESEGRLVVAAAGNDGLQTNNYPAACAGAMPVANSEVNGLDQDVIHTGTNPSNYGLWVSLAGPGTAVLSTARTAAACPTCDPSLVSATGYASVTGTSFSTPLAAGAAALVIARAPAITNADLRALLFSTGAALQAPAAHIRRIEVFEALKTFNTAPTAINFPGACIPENTNTAAGVSVGTLSTVDPDPATPFEYTIVGGADQAKFSIGGVNGDQLIITDGVLDFEAKASYAVTVRSTDIGNLTVDQGLVVAVCNVNEPPVVTGGTFSIAENSPNGTVVGSVSATDPEGGPVSFSITGGNTGGAFTISASGQITVANSVALDFETTPVFTLTVTASDGINNPTAIVTVNLTDVAETIPNPILVFSHVEAGTDAFGNTVDRYFFTVSNFASYPAAMFAPRPDLPPCGLNTSASRTWVDFFRSDNNDRLFGFCALGSPSDLNGIWFGVIPSGAAHPAAVYITLTDRETGIVYTSNSAPIP